MTPVMSEPNFPGNRYDSEDVTLSGFDSQVPACRATGEASRSGVIRCFGPKGRPQHDKCGCGIKEVMLAREEPAGGFQPRAISVGRVKVKVEP